MFRFNPFIKDTVEEPPEWLVEMRKQQAVVRDQGARIRAAMCDAGFDPNILDQLPAAYVAAAIALGVK